MRKRKYRLSRRLLVALAVISVPFGMLLALGTTANAQDSASHLITVYDRGASSTFLTKATHLDEALKEAAIALDPHDAVEPSRDEELVAPEYKVNIYRARPVIVVDGAVRKKTITPYQTAERIVKDIGIGLNPEDGVILSRSNDLTGDGAGLVVTIDRALPLQLDLYGKVSQVHTRTDTVKELLAEKGITLGGKDRLSVPLETSITAGMNVRVWREGIQTTAIEQPIGFGTELVYDADRPVGYRAIEMAGNEGIRTITYQIEIKDGVEISRTELARLDTKTPTSQKLVIGIKGLENGLTRSKGAGFFTDSKGVTHRETYYDLNMSVVMNACGQGGRYSVRFDGMKIDSEGYIIIAANYAKYPRCSIVETSAGPARVYDTGGFVARYPDGYDLATDWSRADGV